MHFPPLTRSVGTAERSMRALLEKELARANLTFPQWTVIVFTHTSPLSFAQILQRQLAGRIVAMESEARQSVTGLVDAGLLNEDTAGALNLSEKGRELFASLSKAVEIFTFHLYGDLPPADLEVTHRTLLEIADRAAELLKQDKA